MKNNYYKFKKMKMMNKIEKNYLSRFNKQNQKINNSLNNNRIIKMIIKNITTKIIIVFKLVTIIWIKIDFKLIIILCKQKTLH